MARVQRATAELGPDRSLHAVISGAGPDIVLVHGGLATHQDWLCGPFQRIAQLGRTLAIDRPGHGNSRRPRLDLEIHQQADLVLEGLEMQGVRQAVLVAHSFGTRLALALAERHPHLIAHLILVAPAAFREFRPLEHSLILPRATPVLGPAFSTSVPPLFDRAWIEAVHQLMFAPRVPPPEWRAHYPWDLILDRERMTAEGEDFGELHPLSMLPDIKHRRVTVPTTIISGMADLIVDPRSQAERLTDLIDARFVPVAGEGHMVHHSRPDLLLEIIAGTLANVAPVSA